MKGRGGNGMGWGFFFFFPLDNWRPSRTFSCCRSACASRLGGWGGAKVEQQHVAHPSLIPRLCKVRLCVARVGFEGWRGRKSIEFVIQSFICVLIDRAGHSCHIHNLINLPYQKNNGSFSESLNSSLINAFHCTDLKPLKMQP